MNDLSLYRKDYLKTVMVVIRRSTLYLIVTSNYNRIHFKLQETTVQQT